MMDADVVLFVFIRIHQECLTDCPTESDAKKKNVAAPLHAVIWFELPD